MLKKPQIIAPVYNDGVIYFYEKDRTKDEYGTPIRREHEKSLVFKEWFRYIGITAEDTYYSNAEDKRLSLKVAVRSNVQINVKWTVEINGVSYEIYRQYYNSRKNETEISLVEV